VTGATMAGQMQLRLGIGHVAAFVVESWLAAIAATAKRASANRLSFMAG